MDWSKLTQEKWNEIIKNCPHEDYQSEDDGSIYCPDCNSIIGHETN